MIGLYISSFVTGVFVVWAIVSVRADYASRQTLTSTSVALVWVAYVAHAGVVMGAAGLQAWPMPLQPGLAAPLGAVLAVAGIATAATAIWNFRSIRRMSGLRTDELIASGIYAWSRNPQNLGWGLALLSIAVMSRSGFALLLAVLFILAIHAYIVFLEEPYLEELYGEVYRHYRSKTKRYLGFPR